MCPRAAFGLHSMFVQDVLKHEMNALTGTTYFS